jgi:WXG100 family type VII secretion target
MPAPIVRADYDELTKVAGVFGQNAEGARRALEQLRKQMETLQQGDWLGGGAQAFYAEMNGQVVPTLTRLVKALEAANQTTLQVSRIVKAAEDEAARHLRANGRAAAAGPAGTIASGVIRGSAFAGVAASISGSANLSKGGGFLSSVGGFFKSVGKHAGDFFVGAGKELFSIGKMAVMNVVAPWYSAYETVKGLWNVVKDPGAAWQAFKAPYVEAWKNGRPFEAIGRGSVFVASLFVGGGEAKAAMEARHAANLANKAARTVETVAMNEAGKVAKVAEAGEAAASKAGKAGVVEEALAKEKQALEDMAKTGQGEALPNKNPMATPGRPLAEIEADLANAAGEVGAAKDVAGDFLRERGASGLGGVHPETATGASIVQRELEAEIARLREAAGASAEAQGALATAERLLRDLRRARERLRDLEAERLGQRGIEIPDVPWPRE